MKVKKFKITKTLEQIWEAQHIIKIIIKRKSNQGEIRNDKTDGAVAQFIEKKYSSRYEAEKFELEEKVAKAEKVAKLEGTPSFKKNKVQLPLSTNTYWKIKHHDDVTRQSKESELSIR